MNACAMTLMESTHRKEYARRETPPAKVPGITKSDSLLIAQLRKGDERAFYDLVNKNHGALIRMAQRYVATRDVAEEVVQDTWVAVIDGVHSFEGRSTLNTWIFSILIHKAKDRGVRESRHVTFSALKSYGDDECDDAVDPSRFHASGELAGEWALPPQTWNEQTPERLLASKQAFEALGKALEALPKRLREVLLLKDVECLESNEICERLKITDSNLYVRLHRARERIREAVDIALRGRRTMNATPDVSSGAFATRFANFGISHAHACKRRIGEQAIRRDPVIYRARFTLQQIIRYDLVIVVRSVRECAPPVAIANSPNARYIRAQLIVHCDIAARIGIDACVIQPQIIGVRHAPHCQQQVRAFNLTCTSGTIELERNTFPALATLVKGHTFRAGLNRDAFVTQYLKHALRYIRIFTSNDLRCFFNDSYAGAEAPVNLRKLKTDVAATDYQ